MTDEPHFEVHLTRRQKAAIALGLVVMLTAVTALAIREGAGL